MRSQALKYKRLMVITSSKMSTICWKEIPAVRQTGVRSEIVRYRKSPIDWVKGMTSVRSVRKGRRKNPPSVSTYRNESEQLYSEDVDQHMAILTEAVTPAAEISVKEIQVGDVGVPQSSVKRICGS